MPLLRRAQLAGVKAEAEAQQRRLAAAESASAASGAQLLEAQAALSQAQLEVATGQQQAEQRLAALQLQCKGCAEKAGQMLDLQEEVQGLKARHVRLELAVQQEKSNNKALFEGLDDCRSELDQAKAALVDAVRSRDHLFVQLHGSSGGSAAAAAAAAGGAGAAVPGSYCGSDGVQCAADLPMLAWGSAAHSSVKRASCASGYAVGLQQQQQLLPMQPGDEGLIQKCSSMQQRLQEQDAELRSLRQQLLELQLQLSDAQSAASIAQQQLQHCKAELESAEAHATKSAAAATAADSASEALRQELAQLQLQLAKQSPELAAARAQVEKLEAQQRVLLGDMKESTDAAASAAAGQQAAVTRAEALQVQLDELQGKSEAAQLKWKQQEAALQEAKEQVWHWVVALFCSACCVYLACVIQTVTTCRHGVPMLAAQQGVKYMKQQETKQQACCMLRSTHISIACVKSPVTMVLLQ
jgi:chromosome segregation ATPase